MYCLGQSNCNTKPKNLRGLTLRSCGRLAISYNICWSGDPGSSHLVVQFPRAFEASALRKEKESPKFCLLLFFFFNPYHLPPSVSFSFPSFLSFVLLFFLPPLLRYNSCTVKFTLLTTCSLKLWPWGDQCCFCWHFIGQKSSHAAEYRGDWVTHSLWQFHTRKRGAQNANSCLGKSGQVHVAGLDLSCQEVMVLSHILQEGECVKQSGFSFFCSKCMERETLCRDQFSVL